MQRAIFASKWRVYVAVAATVAVFATAGVLAVVNVTELQATPDCSTLEAADFAKAGALARDCDSDVEVLAERTPWETSWALSDGTARLEVSAVPSRTLADGVWVAIDHELVAHDDGVSPAASVFPIELNPGGEAGVGKPLGTITQNEKEFALWFPLELPVPVLSDSQAIYQLADGVRLIVSVDTDTTGFIPVVELADENAAARFAVMLAEAGGAHVQSDNSSENLEIPFGVTVSDGLKLIVDEADAVHVVDERNETHFLAPPPSMWDSSGEEKPVVETATEVGVSDRTRSPAPGDRIAMMPVEIVDSAIVVTPNSDMFADPTTVWPIYIDPPIAAQSASWRVAVRTGGYTNTIHQWGDISSSMLGQGTGYCNHVASCNVVFKQRLAWQYSGLSIFNSLVSSDIISAQFRVYGSHSYNCTAQIAYLYHVTSISSATTWSNLPWQAAVSSRTEAQRSGCAAGGLGYREYNAIGIAQWAAIYNQPTIAMGIVVNEGNMTGWKRFRADATFLMNYNRAPNTPTSLQLTDPVSTACVTGAGRPVIATTTPTVSAISSDPDAGATVQTAFTVAAADNHADVRWSSGNLPAIATGLRRSATVPSGLADGGIYAWQARAYDGARYSAWSAWCEFEVDVSAPGTPTIAPALTNVAAIYVEDSERGGIGQQGKFVFDAGAASDVTAFVYDFNAPASPSTATIGPDGTTTVSFTPTTTGTVTLTVRSRDAAGNVSAPVSYVFRVASPTEDGIWMFDEGSGDTAADSAGTPARPLTLGGGALWGEGPHGLFDARSGDSALVLDGVNGFAAADAPVIDTTTSFVVSAFVWLDPAKVAQGQSFTALSQDGVAESGFKLGYSKDCVGDPGGCWSFSMPDASGAGAETAVYSSEPVVGGQWVLLLGEHDADDGEMRLWTCSVGTPDDPSTGNPLNSEVTRTATPWAASGAFAVGRGQSAGAGALWWPGAIDNVRVFSGDVVAESKIRRMCQGAEAADFGGDDLALDPTEVGL